MSDMSQVVYILDEGEGDGQGVIDCRCRIEGANDSAGVAGRSTTAVGAFYFSCGHGYKATPRPLAETHEAQNV